MDDLEVLDELIRSTAVVTVSSATRRLTLSEPSQPGCTIEVLGVDDGAVCFRADAFPDPGAIFSGANGCCCRSDFILFVAHKDQLYVVCIEIKSTSDKAEHIQQQLRGAACLVEYTQAVGRHFWSQPDFLKGIRMRFVCIAQTSLNQRRPVIDRPKGRHDRPDRPLRVSAAKEVELKRLLHG
ncbi:MAG: hypothetical protein IT204_05760 [Fimbriimonadaceae bacterium]|nr:hypothetical protein [Fimbriimonadaceae bacterium]